MVRWKLHGGNFKLLYTNYGAHTGLGQMHTFFIDVQEWSYSSCNDN